MSALPESIHPEEDDVHHYMVSLDFNDEHTECAVLVGDTIVARVSLHPGRNAIFAHLWPSDGGDGTCFPLSEEEPCM